MIVYKATKDQFIKDFTEGSIEDIIRSQVEEKLYKKVGKSEYRSWANSLPMIGVVMSCRMT